MAYSPILKGIYDDPAAKRAGHWVMEPYAGPDAEARLAAVAEVAAEVGAHAEPGGAGLAAAPELAHDGAADRAAHPAAVRGLLPALDVKLSDDQVARLDAAGA